MTEIRTLASRLVYRNAWMDVREDDIERSDGSTGIYGVVDKPDFALVIPMDATGFYLVEQFRYPAQGRYWEFPQGSWEDRADADPVEVARGELAEETGLRAGRWRHLGTLHEAYGFCSQRAHIYLAEELEVGPARRTPEEADLRSAHVTFAEFRVMVTEGRITDAATLASYALLSLASG